MSATTDDVAAPGPVRQERRHLFVGGRWEEPSEGGHIDVVCPSTEEVVGRAPEAGPADVDRAVRAARSAFEDSWWRTADPARRADVIERACDLLAGRLEGMPELVTTEMGLPISVSRLANSSAPVQVARFAAEVARAHAMTETLPSTVPAIVRREPLGVVAAIAPWNGPFQQATYKIVYPLLAGCAVVFKPAPQTPLDAFLLAEVLQEAGVPDGLVSILPGDHTAGEALVAHPEIDKVSFTGSAVAGRQIGAVCGRNLTHAALELGGKSAAIVLDDADLEIAIPALAAGVFSNAGQVCAATSRILVSESRHDEVVERLVAVADGMRVGDPFDEATQMGPLVTELQRERVESHVASALADGARLVAGGGRPETTSRGWFVEPTVFDHVDNRSRIAREEVFGPVAVVSSFADDDEAVVLANDSDYDLNGSVYTADDERAMAVADRVRTGTFTVNGFCINMEAPFGGRGGSGLGRKFGPHGLESFFELKTVNFPAEVPS